MQNLELNDDQNAKWQIEGIEKFFDTQYYKQPSLLYVDEGHDFYGTTGVAKYGSAIQRCYRAGRERGMASLFGSQRPKTINLQILTESNLLYLFFIKFKGDLVRLQEMGAPKEIELPEQSSHRFRFFRDGRLHPKHIRLDIGG